MEEIQRVPDARVRAAGRLLRQPDRPPRRARGHRPDGVHPPARRRRRAADQLRARVGLHQPDRLRAQAAADTKGLTRAWRINSPKAALAMYEAMCSLADHFEAADQRGQTWEWVQQLQRVAAITTGTSDVVLGAAAAAGSRLLQEARAGPAARRQRQAAAAGADAAARRRDRRSTSPLVTWRCSCATTSASRTLARTTASSPAERDRRRAGATPTQWDSTEARPRAQGSARALPASGRGRGMTSAGVCQRVS